MRLINLSHSKQLINCIQFKVFQLNIEKNKYQEVSQDELNSSSFFRRQMDCKLKYINQKEYLDKCNINNFKQKFDENPKQEKLMKITELKLMSEILKSSNNKIKLPAYTKINSIQNKKNHIISQFSNTRSIINSVVYSSEQSSLPKLSTSIDSDLQKSIQFITDRLNYSQTGYIAALRQSNSERFMLKPKKKLFQYNLVKQINKKRSNLQLLNHDL